MVQYYPNIRLEFVERSHVNETLVLFRLAVFETDFFFPWCEKDLLRSLMYLWVSAV